MKQTVLHQKHLQLKAKMTDFQGWQVPQAYSDVLDEHHAVRTAAGLFDLGFLGRIEIAGRDASGLLQQVFTRNIRKMPEGTARYGLICDNDGRILDDCLLFRMGNGDDRFLLSCNACNTGKILSWLSGHAPPHVRVSERTHSLAHLALQGPKSPGILERFLGASKRFKLRSVKEVRILDTAVVISRTGYTGEAGYEFFPPAEKAELLWDGLTAAGSEFRMLPCGMASRDILRLEMGYPMYGTDIDENRTPVEAGMLCYVNFGKDFIGREALLRLKEKGTEQKLAGFVLVDKSVPKTGSSIFSENREIGVVTSAGLSPSVRKGIGLGYVGSRYAQAGQEIEIEVRDREVAAKIVELPFYGKK